MTKHEKSSLIPWSPLSDFLAIPCDRSHLSNCIGLPLDLLLGEDIGIPALRTLLALTDKKKVEVSRLLGQMTLFLPGPPNTYLQHALEYFREAAAGGDSWSQLAIAVLGIVRSYREVRRQEVDDRLWQLSRHGLGVAHYQIAYLQRDSGSASFFKHLEDAATAGKPSGAAALELGLRFQYGLGTRQNLETAAYWMRRACEISPSCPDTHLALAVHYQERGHTENAELQLNLARAYREHEALIPLELIVFLPLANWPATHVRALNMEVWRLQTKQLLGRLDCDIAAESITAYEHILRTLCYAQDFALKSAARERLHRLARSGEEKAALILGLVAGEIHELAELDYPEVPDAFELLAFAATKGEVAAALSLETPGSKELYMHIERHLKRNLCT